jgi:hypothetical protein
VTLFGAILKGVNLIKRASGLSMPIMLPFPRRHRARYHRA